MHKRAAQLLPDASASVQRTFARCRGGATNPRRPPPAGGKAKASDGRAQRWNPKYKRAPLPDFFSDASTFPVVQELRQILSPEVSELMEGASSETDKAKRKGTAKEIVAPKHDLTVGQTPRISNEKLAFDSLQEMPFDEALFESASNADTPSEGQLSITSGTLVELRRSEMSIYGVVLYAVLLNRRWVVRTMSNNGEIYSHFEHDITFQFPNFLDKTLLKKCGIMEIVRTEEELDARVEVLKALRSFEKRFEAHRHPIAALAQSTSFYDSVAHEDGNKWGHITLREAATRLLGRTDVTPMDLLSVQWYMFNTSAHFEPEPRRFLRKQAFWIRPRVELEDLRRVTDMAIHRAPSLDSFVEKAQIAISRRREDQTKSWNEPPSRQPIPGIEWSDDDRSIIRFMIAAMQPRRTIQHDEYEIPVALILKAVGAYSSEAFDSHAIHKFLLDLGIVAPWEEINTRRGSIREEPVPLNMTPSTASPIVSAPCGPTDLYSHDISESIRHDFGDSPVFVIDDWGAEELDDGISVERIPSDPNHIWLHAHVADPTTLLPPSHPIARQAIQASTTLYYSDRTIPMLPPNAGFHKYSLGSKPGEPDLALTFSAKLNTTGEIVDYKVRPSIIRNVHVLKYDTVDEALGLPLKQLTYPFGNLPAKNSYKAPLDPALVRDLQLIRQYTLAIESWRVRQGALTFALPHYEINFDTRPLPDDIMGVTTPSEFRGFPRMKYAIADSLESGARKVVAECMQTAGRVASRFFRDRGVPAIRRSVGPLQEEIRGGIQELLASRASNGFVDAYTALRLGVSAPSAKATTVPGPHSLLGIPADEGYMKVTSPLRRFGDIIAHWQIKHALLNPHQPILFDETWIAHAAEYLEVRELTAKRTEAFQNMFWAHSFLLRWIQDPEAATRTNDPLRSLTARMFAMPVKDSRRNLYRRKVYVPQLGLHAVINDWPKEIELGYGDEVDVHIDEVQLGVRPQLLLKIRR